MRGLKYLEFSLIILLILNATLVSSIFTLPCSASRQEQVIDYNKGVNEDLLENFTLLSNRSIEITNRTVIDENVQISDSYLFFNLSGEYIIEKNGILKLNNTIISLSYMLNRIPSIHVQSGGKLEFNFVTTLLFFNWMNITTLNIIVEPGASLKMTNCNIILLLRNYNDTSVKIRSDLVNIENCDFFEQYNIFSVENISSVIINNCSFPLSSPFEMVNSTNITLNNCHFHEDYNSRYIEESYTIKLIDSGNSEPIKLVNCSLEESVKSYPKYWERKPLLKLVRSRLDMYNVSTFFYIKEESIDKILELDNESQVMVNWKIDLKTVTTKNKTLGDVDIVITDNLDAEVFRGKTDPRGNLNGVWLLHTEIHGNITVDHNPFKIKATKNKDEYSDTTYITLDNENTSKILLIELQKSDKSENDLEDNLLTFCICGMVIVTIFLILMSVNVYLARKKLGISGTPRIGTTEPGQQLGLADKDVITCSECGTQVTDDATFCPHCGEYFEGEEVFCPGCNARINENTESCPKCGREFDVGIGSKKPKAKTQIVGGRGTQDKIDIAKNMAVIGKIYCSECGAVVDKDDGECPGCGLKFKERKDIKKDKKYALKLTEMEEEEGEKASVREKKTHDGTEKTVNSGAIKHKDKDGKGVDTQSVERDGDIFMCSICGGEVYGSTKVCPSCGTELE
jgi:predicted amidophosphoribosyltransferase